MRILEAVFRATAMTIGVFWLTLLLAGTALLLLVLALRFATAAWIRRRWHRAPCCLNCGRPGKFAQLHATIPGRYCGQCAIAVVEAREIFRALERRTS